MCLESPNKVTHPVLRKSPVAVKLLPLWGAQCSKGYSFLFALACACYSNGSSRPDQLPQLPRRLIPIEFRPQKAGGCPPTSQKALISPRTKLKVSLQLFIEHQLQQAATLPLQSSSATDWNPGFHNAVHQVSFSTYVFKSPSACQDVLRGPAHPVQWTLPPALSAH